MKDGPHGPQERVLDCACDLSGSQFMVVTAADTLLLSPVCWVYPIMGLSSRSL